MNAATRKSWNRRMVVQFAIGALMGTAGVFLLDQYGLEPRDGITASHLAAGLVGLVYLITGLCVGAGTVMPRIGAKLLAVEDVDELREQQRLLIASSIAIVGIGMALLTLVVAGPGGIIAARSGAIFAALVLAIVVVIGFVTRNLSDEFNETVGRDAIYMAWNLLSVIGGGWAILSYGAILPAPGALDWLAMIFGFALLGMIWQGERRGLGRARESS